MDINELVRMYSDEVELIKYDNESAATLEAAGLNTEGSSVNHTHEFAKNSEMEEFRLSQVYKIFTRMCLNNWGGINHKVLQFNAYIKLFSGKSGWENQPSWMRFR